MGGNYRKWLSWVGGGNSPEPAFGSFDAMGGPVAFVKDAFLTESGRPASRSVARGLLTIAYDGRARAGRSVQQELDAINLEPPWGRLTLANYSRAKAFCLTEPRCRGFTWHANSPGGAAAAIEPAPAAPGRWRFVTDSPRGGGPRVPVAFYASSAATNLGGLVSSPIVLPCARSLNDTVALTSLSSFMSTSQEYDLSAGSLDLGVLGSVSSLPAGFSAEWLMTIDDGFNSALRKAGAAVLQRGGTAKAKRAHAAEDVSLNHLGYATQQGAWYYYNTAPRPSQEADAARAGGAHGGLVPTQQTASTQRMWAERFATSGTFGCAVNVSDPPAQQCKTYSETIVDVKRRADEVSLPYRWWLMDSWWYPKGSLNGVHTWDAPPSTFPGSDGRGGDHAIAELANATGWHIVAHTRFFAADTSYAKENGGRYAFVVERGRFSAHPTDGGIALPVDERFWRELLLNKTRSIGLLAGVEIDWMYNQFAGTNATLSNVTIAGAWLTMIGAAAMAAGVKLTYCMAWARMLLASTESEAVTVARASIDYYPNTAQWNIGYTSLLADSLGLRPSKDLWWSSNRALGRYGRTWSKSAEHHARLHAAAATLSTGPVMLGDLVRSEDPHLIMRSCTADGLLLQPDRPATPIDANILARVSPGSAGPGGTVLSTHVGLFAGQRWTYVLAVGTPTYQLRADELALPPSTHGYVAVEANTTGVARVLDGSHALPLQSRGEWDFQLWTVAPRSSNGWAFLGEAATKWVGVSRRRFVSVEADTDSGLLVHCRGAGGERVQLLAVPPGALRAVAVWHRFAASGVASVHITASSGEAS